MNKDTKYLFLDISSCSPDFIAQLAEQLGAAQPTHVTPYIQHYQNYNEVKETLCGDEPLQKQLVELSDKYRELKKQTAALQGIENFLTHYGISFMHADGTPREPADIVNSISAAWVKQLTELFFRGRAISKGETP